MTVRIHGDGVAARCCAHLLAKAGIQVAVNRTGRARLPAVMLSDSAVRLMKDVFERPELFHTAPKIQRRIVSWGENPQPVAFEHSAIVVSEEYLLESIRPADPDAGQINGHADWEIFASRPLPPAATENRYGSRLASAIPVDLTEDSEPAACWMESVENGWLFLITNAPGTGWLLAVGDKPGKLLERSRLAGKRIKRMGALTGEFPAAPRIVTPLCGPGWLACGTAGMAFDPLCGDGVANAIREAILAAAVVKSVATDSTAFESLQQHYEARLTAGFERHLSLCLGYYTSGRQSPWWTREAEAVNVGLQWCRARLADHREFRYRLNGFDLQPVP